MSGSEPVRPDVAASLPTTGDEDDSAPRGGGLLWPGDPGELSADLRSALVALIRGPYLSQAAKPNLWAALLADQAVVRSRLADLYLDLALDTDREIAFARNVQLVEGSVPQMMRKLPLNFVDTALLLHLRHVQLRAASQGERAFVGLDEIQDHLQQLRAPGDTDPAQLARRIGASVKRMLEYSILDTTDTDDRFEVLPIVGLLLSPDVVAGLEAEYRGAVGRQGTGEPADGDALVDDEGEAAGEDGDEGDRGDVGGTAGGPDRDGAVEREDEEESAAAGEGAVERTGGGPGEGGDADEHGVAGDPEDDLENRGADGAEDAGE